MSGSERALEAAVGQLAKADHGTRVSSPRAASPRAVQEITSPMDATAFEHRAEPGSLRHLLGAYFRVAELSSGGLMRVRWTSGAPTVALRWPGLPLIVMGTPTIAGGSARRAISVPVIGGLVAAQGGSARLAIVLTSRGTSVRLSVELSGYQPRSAHIWPVPWIYRLQARVHARVGQRFARRCARAWSGASDSCPRSPCRR